LRTPSSPIARAASRTLTHAIGRELGQRNEHESATEKFLVRQDQPRVGQRLLIEQDVDDARSPADRFDAAEVPFDLLDGIVKFDRREASRADRAGVGAPEIGRRLPLARGCQIGPKGAGLGSFRWLHQECRTSPPGKE
jgi:hypothetical protein